MIYFRITHKLKRKKMKKLVLFLSSLLLFGVAYTQYQTVGINEKSSLEILDECQSKYGVSDIFWKEFNNSHLGFNLDGKWIYVLSYEPINDYPNDHLTRRAYLYYRNINEIGNWKISGVEQNPVFQHAYTRTFKISYDNNRWHNKNSPGTSAVEIVHTNTIVHTKYEQNIKKTYVVMFIGIRDRYLNNPTYEFTQLTIFDPIYVYSDGSIIFEQKIVPCDFLFKYESREGNIFYGKKYRRECKPEECKIEIKYQPDKNPHYAVSFWSKKDEKDDKYNNEFRSVNFSY